MKTTVDSLGCEVRSVESGLRAFFDHDTGTFLVRSTSRPGLRWRVAVEAVIVRGEPYLRARCECESGTNRPSEACACLHGATVLRRLEREGLARWNGGIWTATERLAS